MEAEILRKERMLLFSQSERVQGQGALGCYSFTHTSQEDDKTPEDE